MAQVGETEVVAGNVRDIVNRLSRDMTNRNPFTVHQQRAQPPPPAAQQFVATYGYNSKQEDELSFVVGDIIELINEVEDGWSKGRLKSTGAIGMFPTNFVAAKPLTPVSSSSVSSASTSRPPPTSATSNVVMRAEPTAITRTPSTVISSDQFSSLRMPAAAAATTTASTASASAETAAPTEPVKTKEMARVKFVYNPQHDDELALRDLDMLINVTNKNCGDAGWFEGELNGKKGLFPDNFVELVQVPLGTESGAKFSTVSRQTNLNSVAHKPPPVNPPQPAVPPKPAKISAVDSNPPSTAAAPPTQTLFNPISAATSSSSSSSSAMPNPSISTPLKQNNFDALRKKMADSLKVVAPEKVVQIQQKPAAEQRDRSSTAGSIEDHQTDAGAGDQVAELHHITKSRARPPKNRPMSMVMNRNRSSDESPTGRLSSPTSMIPTSGMSASMFVPAVSKETPFKTTSSATPATVVPPSSASKPALRPIPSNSFAESNDSSSSSSHRKLASPEASKTSSDSEFVPRSEFNALAEKLAATVEKCAAMEARILALEERRF